MVQAWTLNLPFFVYRLFGCLSVLLLFRRAAPNLRWGQCPVGQGEFLNVHYPPTFVYIPCGSIKEKKREFPFSFFSFYGPLDMKYEHYYYSIFYKRI